jgi:hypothetical protein
LIAICLLHFWRQHFWGSANVANLQREIYFNLQPYTGINTIGDCQFCKLTERNSLKFTAIPVSTLLRAFNVENSLLFTTIPASTLLWECQCCKLTARNSIPFTTFRHQHFWGSANVLNSLLFTTTPSSTPFVGVPMLQTHSEKSL